MKIILYLKFKQKKNVILYISQRLLVVRLSHLVTCETVLHVVWIMLVRSFEAHFKRSG